MSRIGKKPILIPEKVTVGINDRQFIVKGPLGELEHELPEELAIAIKEGKIFVSLKKETKKSPALWGLTRTILANMVKGVVEGFEKRLEIQGIGYRASLKDERHLELRVGFSHPVIVEIPAGITVSVEKNIILVRSVDKQKVGEFAAQIRRIKPAEPYKGKGIRYFGEKIRMKEGKKAVGATG